MKRQVLHTVWCNISGEAAGEIWNWLLLGVKGLNRPRRICCRGRWLWKFFPMFPLSFKVIWSFLCGRYTEQICTANVIPTSRIYKTSIWDNLMTNTEWFTRDLLHNVRHQFFQRMPYCIEWWPKNRGFELGIKREKCLALHLFVANCSALYCPLPRTR